MVRDPRLVNENGINPADFRLLGDSLDRNRGTLLVDVQGDFFGTPRPQESAHDIGAHEIVAGSLHEEESLSGRPSAR